MHSTTEAEKFYQTVLEILLKNHANFLIGGTYAVGLYTGIDRPTKDLDIYTKAGEYTQILDLFQTEGYVTEITDTRWLAKITQGDFFIDILFGTASETCRVDTSWFTHAPKAELFGFPIRLIPLEELIWVKSFMQDRRRSEGPDVNHLLLRKGKEINWKRLLMRMDPYWELFFSHILEFRFIYPSEREIIPKWVIETMLDRIKYELALPSPRERICRGALLSRMDYEIDVKEWGFKTVLEL